MFAKPIHQFKKAFKKILPSFVLDWYHFCLALLAALVYGFPGRRLKVIGITGTSGKSTVVALTTAVLEEAGFKVASLSSIKFCIAGKEEINTKRMTLPGRFFVQQFLRRAVMSNCQYAVLEITSEGIVQHRHRFIGFEAVVFTNLSPEHIESHGSFEKYRQAKGQLFVAAKNIHIINLDDENAEYFNQFKAKEKWGFSTNEKLKIKNEKQQPEIRNLLEAKNIEVSEMGLKFSVNGLEFNLKLLGEFNVYNALAAITVAQSQGISLEICQKALEKFSGVPGRMEQVISEPFRVFVDYAITPNALQKAYETLTKNYILKTNKLVCVLGACGGGRDKWKRPVLGQIAAKYCGQIILTNEDPYDENPQGIAGDIKKGIQNTKYQIQDTKIILDRREAINKALNLAGAGDVVIITGKGCEPTICLANGKQVPWDDRQVAREEMRKLQEYQKSSLSLLNGRQKVILGEVNEQYEILEHKADLKIRVFGKTREELFQNAMLGMFAAAVYEPEEASEAITREIRIESTDLQALLVDFLSQLLYFCETNREVYEKVSFGELSEKHLFSTLTGKKLKKMGVQIKGVTYHDLEVKQQKDYWEAVILFDI